MQLTFVRLAAMLLSMFTIAACSAETANAPDSDIRDVIVRASIAVYDGACACPYQKTKAGQTCGATSAYKNEGRGGVLCYKSDVTPKMIERYKSSKPAPEKP